jgi:hypothetical protein
MEERARAVCFLVAVSSAEWMEQVVGIDFLNDININDGSRSQL